MTVAPPTAETLALIRNALAVSPLFSQFTPGNIDRLARVCSFRSYLRGQHVPVGSGAARQALLTVSGLLEIGLVTANGRRFVMGLAGPGELVGLIRLFNDAPVKYGYIVRERTSVIHVPCLDLQDILDLEPTRWKAVSEYAFNRKVEALGTVLDQVVIGGADHRIAATLLRLAILFGVKKNAGTLLKLRLSQDDLADMLCVSRQTVNKELHHLEDMGLIGCAYNTVTILQIEALREIVNIPAE